MDSSHNNYVVIIGTLDTKGPEVSFLRDQLQELGCKTRVMDVGLVSSPSCHADIDREQVTSRANADIESLLKEEEGKLKAMDAMALGAISLLEEGIASEEVAGVMALGGGVGTQIGMKVMRALPFGLPKIMISTLPYDPRSHMGGKDIVVFPSVADILGLNPMLRRILRSAAGAMAGMAGLSEMSGSSKKVIGITALGVTNPLIMACRKILEDKGFEVAAFHANGVGGRAFEEWAGSGMFTGILDLTTHELTSLLFGGVATPSQNRLETAALKGVPQVVAPGGLDFISKGPIDTLSEEDRKKIHYRHSPMFTHVRVNSSEMEEVARVVAKKLNRGQGPAAVAIPLGGFSDQGRAGGHIADNDADMKFVKTLKNRLNKNISVVEVDAHINDESFARAVCSVLFQLLGEG